MPAVHAQLKLATVEAWVRDRNQGSLRNMTIREAEIVHIYAEFMIRHIRERWPVDTGTSRDAWFVDVTTTAHSGYRLIFENPMWYSSWVHRRGGTPERPLWSRLIPEAVDLFIALLNNQLMSEMAATEAALEAAVARGADRRGTLLNMLQTAVELTGVAL